MIAKVEYKQECQLMGVILNKLTIFTIMNQRNYRVVKHIKRKIEDGEELQEGNTSRKTEILKKEAF